MTLEDVRNGGEDFVTNDHVLALPWVVISFLHSDMSKDVQLTIFRPLGSL